MTLRPVAVVAALVAAAWAGPAVSADTEGGCASADAPNGTTPPGCVGLAARARARPCRVPDKSHGSPGAPRLLLRLDRPAPVELLRRELAALDLELDGTIGTIDPGHRPEQPGPGLGLCRERMQEPAARALGFIVAIPRGSALGAEAWASRLSGWPAVRYAVAERFPAMELRSRHVPDDPLFPLQWPLDNRREIGEEPANPRAGTVSVSGADIDAPEAWSITRGSPETVIAVLDDGVDISHPDLAPNVSPLGRDFTRLPAVEGGFPRGDGDNHGTAVAGVAAARGDDGLGITGACPLCSILPIRVDGASNIEMAAAYRYAIDAGADIIVNSWGYARPTAVDDAVRDAIEIAAATGRDGRGAVVVFSMTNEVVDNCGGPIPDISSLDAVIAVGVSDHDDRVGGSGFGACTDLVAPARPRLRSTRGVVTTDRTGLAGYSADAYHRSFGGTSAAAPLVAGVAGLLLSLNPELSADAVRRILEQTADKIDREHAAYDNKGFSDRAGWGRINAGRALAPSVAVRVEPEVVTVGQPFALTVTATAPFGIAAIAWRLRDAAGRYADWTEDATARGENVHSRTWQGLTLPTAGTFRFEAIVRDSGSPAADGYPHVGHTPNDEIEGLVTVEPVHAERGQPWPGTRRWPTAQSR